MPEIDPNNPEQMPVTPEPTPVTPDPAAAAAASGGTSIWVWIISVIILITLGGGAYFWFSSSDDVESLTSGAGVSEEVAGSEEPEEAPRAVVRRGGGEEDNDHETESNSDVASNPDEEKCAFSEEIEKKYFDLLNDSIAKVDLSPVGFNPDRRTSVLKDTWPLEPCNFLRYEYGGSIIDIRIYSDIDQLYKEEELDVLLLLAQNKTPDKYNSRYEGFKQLYKRVEEKIIGDLGILKVTKPYSPSKDFPEFSIPVLVFHRGNIVFDMGASTDTTEKIDNILDTAEIFDDIFKEVDKNFKK